MLLDGLLSLRTFQGTVFTEPARFMASTTGPIETACGATVEKISAYVLEDLEPEQPLHEKIRAGLEKHGYTNGASAEPEVSTSKECRMIVEFQATSTSDSTTAYAVARRGPGRVFFVWYLADPSDFELLRSAFRASAKSIVIRP